MARKLTLTELVGEGTTFIGMETCCVLAKYLLRIAVLECKLDMIQTDISKWSQPVRKRAVRRTLPSYISYTVRREAVNTEFGWLGGGCLPRCEIVTHRS